MGSGIENRYTVEGDCEAMSYVVQTLKALALRGAVGRMVTISTRELSVELNVSQQTASNRVLALLDAGLVTRRMGTKGQSVRLTREGVALLKREYVDYQRIFGSREGLRITGTVITGLGEGQYYLRRQQYRRQFSDVLGFEPYEGTLNLRVSEQEMESLEAVPESKRMAIEGFEAEGRSFGEAECIPVGVRGIDCAIVLPKRSHYTNVLEIISAENLRQRFGLNDGDEIVVEIEF
jgi:riboflavin kinase